MINLPEAFEEKMKRLLGDEFNEYIACYNEPRYYGLRVNTAKISVEEFEKICAPYGCRAVVLTSAENGLGCDELRALLEASMAGE